MRACTSAHLFQETSSTYYVQNAFSAIFLNPSNRDMFKQMYDFLGKGVYNMPYFLESTKYLSKVICIASTQLGLVWIVDNLIPT